MSQPDALCSQSTAQALLAKNASVSSVLAMRSCDLSEQKFHQICSCGTKSHRACEEILPSQQLVLRLPSEYFNLQRLACNRCALTTLRSYILHRKPSSPSSLTVASFSIR
uniref:Uncharacterized protein n=1 Tax=Mus musculus TaxID=10090 RepID=Q9D3L8_MOUSE|nr:unnamed protein product [Mus musculus]